MSKRDRYIRQMALPGWGEAQQKKLAEASVLVLGAGGLGCPAMVALALAGVGTLGIVDFDRISLSNLHRQTLYTEKELGLLKVDVAKARLQEMNPDLKINSYPIQIHNKNILDILREYDILIDGSDNFETRYLVNDACVLLNKPFVYASVFQYEGQVAVFNYRTTQGNSSHYRHVFPLCPAQDEIPDCNLAGVAGTLTGIMGNMQANEAIKMITGIGSPLLNRMCIFDALQNTTYEISIPMKSGTDFDMPKTRQELENKSYALSCGVSKNMEIGAEDLQTWMQLQPQDVCIIDIRNAGELPDLLFWPHLKIPMDQLENNYKAWPPHEKLVLFCQTGFRSRKAAQALLALWPEKSIYSLKGGIHSVLPLQENKHV